MATWFITGASRGFGAALVRAALGAGHDVVATGRSVDRLRAALADTDPDRVLTLRADVTEPDSVSSAVEAAVERFGTLDVVVNNAGRGMVGAVEEVGDAETRSLMETNFFGVLTVSRAVLPVLRRQRSGHLVMMSSGGGFTVPGPGFGTYCATKFAVEAVSEALRHELRDLGIGVTLVEPGSFRTDFLAADSVTVAEREIGDYAPIVGPSRQATTTTSGTQTGDPDKAAAAIVQVVDTGTDVFRLPLGDDAMAMLEGELADVSADLRRVRALGLDTAHD